MHPLYDVSGFPFLFYLRHVRHVRHVRELAACRPHRSRGSGTAMALVTGLGHRSYRHDRVYR